MRKKMLVITPRFPYPVIGGDRLRIYHLCKALATKFELHLVSFCDSTSELVYPVDDTVFKKVDRIFLPKWNSYLSTIVAWVVGRPLQLGYYKSTKMQKYIAANIENYDVCLAHLIRTGQYIENLETSIIKVLEMTDAISLNYERVKKEGSAKFTLKKILYSIEAARLKRYDCQTVKNFDLISLVSEIDRNFIDPNNQMPNLQVFTNGVDVEKFDKITISSEAADIVFIGNMKSEQNKDACRYFAKDILPIVRKKNKEILFKVIGLADDDFKNEMLKYDGVIVTGKVDSILESCKGAFCAVAPMRLGAGIQNKILEYMAMALPTVATTIGLEGINAKHGDSVLAADSNIDIAMHILMLKADIKMSHRIGNSGYNFVKKEHCWDTILNRLTETVDKL